MLGETRRCADGTAQRAVGESRGSGSKGARYKSVKFTPYTSERERLTPPGGHAWRHTHQHVHAHIQESSIIVVCHIWKGWIWIWQVCVNGGIKNVASHNWIQTTGCQNWCFPQNVRSKWNLRHFHQQNWPFFLLFFLKIKYSAASHTCELNTYEGFLF